jgi:chromosome segregation ATPase
LTEKTLQDLRESSKSSLSESNAEAKKLIEENSDMKHEISGLKSKVESVDVHFREAIAKVEQLQADVSDAEISKKEIEVQYGELKSRMERMTEGLSRITGHHSVNDVTMVDSLEGKLEGIMKQSMEDIAAIERENKEHKAELIKLRASNAQFTTDIDTLNTSIAELTESKNETEESAKEYKETTEKKLHTQTSRIRLLESRNKELESEVQILEQDIASLEDLVNDMEVHV